MGIDLAPLLIREAARIFPGRLAALDEWTPPWLAGDLAPVTPRESSGRGLSLLAAHPTTCDAVARLLGCEGNWEASEDPARQGVALLREYPVTAAALAEYLN